MAKLYPTLACDVDSNILSAAFPLFDQERIAAVEWSFDTGLDIGTLPPWFRELLHAYSSAGRLIGHGVFFSLFSGRWTPDQEKWLDTLKTVSAEFPLDHVSEHFGFTSGADFHKGAPLPVPYTHTTLKIGRDRLAMIQQSANCPVGLENLAFAFSADEVKRHGAFLDELLTPVNGFVILDLHNLYCQSNNFAVPPEKLIASYPLHRVREIHISGGSWQDSIELPGKKIRRDTHDSAVPAEVFSLLEYALERCPECKYVVMEQLGYALQSDSSRIQFYNDFSKLDEIARCQNANREELPASNFLPVASTSPLNVSGDDALAFQQEELSAILETSSTPREALEKLRTSSLADTSWQVEKWRPEMLEAAIDIAHKWKDGIGRRTA